LDVEHGDVTLFLGTGVEELLELRHVGTVHTVDVLPSQAIEDVALFDGFRQEHLEMVIQGQDCLREGSKPTVPMADGVVPFGAFDRCFGPIAVVHASITIDFLNLN